MSILIFSLFALAVSVWSLVRALKAAREWARLEKEISEIAAHWNRLDQQAQQARERDKR